VFPFFFIYFFSIQSVQAIAGDVMFWAVAPLIAALAGYIYATGNKFTALILSLAAIGVSYISVATHYRTELNQVKERLREAQIEIIEKKEEISKLKDIITQAEEEKNYLREELTKLRIALARDKEMETGYYLEKAIEFEKITEEKSEKFN
jgi:septal ring factor EnvC (AmiA/AmiB activator)